MSELFWFGICTFVIGVIFFIAFVVLCIIAFKDILDEIEEEER